MTEYGDLFVHPVNIEWKIKHFFDLPQTVSYILLSPHFTFSNTEWYLRLHPNGERRKNWMSLYLCKEPSAFPLAIEYDIGIKTIDGSVLRSFIDTEEFGKLRGDSGTDKFIQKSKFLNSGNVATPDGTLTIYCTLQVDDEPVLQSSLSEELNECKREIKYLKEKLSAVSKEKEVLASDIENKVEAAKLKLNEYKKEIKALKEKLSAANKEIEALAADNESNAEAAKLKLNECKKEIKDWKDKLSAAKKEKEALAADIESKVEAAKLRATRLPQNLRELAPDSGECDLKIIFSDKEYMVHGSVLSAKSEVFRRMLQQEDGRRSSMDTLDITRGDPALFEDFLLFMYTGDLKKVPLNNVIALYRIADHYKVEDLKKTCARSLACKMSMEFMIDVQRAIFFRDVAKISNNKTDFVNNE